MAVFTPLPPPTGTFIWAGTGGNSKWDTTTPNWSSTTSSTYVNGGNVVFSDAGQNTAIAITGTGVSPLSVTFE